MESWSHSILDGPITFTNGWNWNGYRVRENEMGTQREMLSRCMCVTCDAVDTAGSLALVVVWILNINYRFIENEYVADF